MMAPIALSQLVQWLPSSLNAQLHQGDAIFSRVNTDTRTLAAGELFVALRGERFDAHDFLSQAVEKNVCACVVEKFYEEIALPQLVVADTLLALGQIAALNRAAYKGHLLAVTGSSGKTTVKTMLANILSECGKTLATKGNLNNHIGVPLTLLQLDADHQYAVIEMGASAIGEIAYLCSLAKPNVSMVNNVMPAHIEGFGSIEGVATAKGEIYQQLGAADTAVVNIDDKFSQQWLNAIKSKTFTVSLHNPGAHAHRNVDCWAKNIVTAEDHIEFTLVVLQKEFQKQARIRINALGEHSVRNALMASAMAYSVGASLKKIQQGLEKFSPIGGRMNRHKGVKQSLVIDDSYNANPGSVCAAIDVLTEMKGTRILVLGDLGELGPNEESIHADLGRYAQQKQLDAVITCGKLSRHAGAAFDEKTSQHFADRESLIDYLKGIATAETIFLIKGSRSAQMDLVVTALIATTH